jgi:hypothetical protein
MEDKTMQLADGVPKDHAHISVLSLNIGKKRITLFCQGMLYIHKPA